ncbi:MAG TPA: protein translocase subunit SecF [Halanaerobiales bacterium]|nr:protein translocase subunit SecF [Halanaerobiales bacterium]
MDIMGKRKTWYTISIAIILVGFVFLLFNGLNFGIDFTGGTILEFTFDNKVTNSEIRDTLSDLEFSLDPQLQQTDLDGRPGVIIKTEELNTDQISSVESVLENKYSSTDMIRSDMVGPLIGKELRRNAIFAIIIASLAIVAYISMRFEFRFAIVAIITLLHDVSIVLGLFAIMQKEINTAFVAALLTIIGYSINDTIVIFDRIRENMKLMRRTPFVEKANTAVLDTLPRSINTSLTTLITILAIYFFGGASLKIFMLALFIGMFAGTYSSIFVASPLLVTWTQKITKK